MNFEKGALSNIATVISGYAFKSSWFGEGENKVIRISDIKDNLVDPIKAVHFDADKHKVAEQFIIQESDILIALSGATVGKFGVADKRAVGMYLNQRVAIIRGHNATNSAYIKYVISGQFMDNLLLLAGGAAQPNLSTKDLANMQIPIPTLDEQKCIATILDKASSICRKRKQTIALTDHLLRSLFLDMFGDPVANPKGWKVDKLNDLSTKISSGSTPKGGSKAYVEKGIPFLRSQNVWRNRVDLDDVVYLDEATHEKMEKTSLKNKDLLITKTGRINTENSSLGRAAMFAGEDDTANINGHVYLIRLKPEVINEFVLYIMTTIEYRDYIRSVCVGGIDKRQINKGHLEEFPIIAPPVELQQQFLEKLKAIEKQKIKLTKQLELANNMFAALTQQAFSGELTKQDKVA
ncbi:restriction endonuclease subunit S [Kiloniella majae]|uniref:restriction endonuclease subunit S n=1 Tax=Kiloniella majae TaxID=1938558 RepID=UPI000A278219|nr:restriction endonuclease subunit S [Kiloniella majae]